MSIIVLTASNPEMIIDLSAITVGNKHGSLWSPPTLSSSKRSSRRTRSKCSSSIIAQRQVAYDFDMVSRPAVFLDRDGTLTLERGYLTRPEQVRLLSGAAEAIRLLREKQFACVLVTNQSEVGRGLMTEAALHRVHDELLRQLHAEGAALDGIYFCPAAPSAAAPDDPERKPAPGILLRAPRELGIDLAQSWLVGDRARALLAGHSAGC